MYILIANLYITYSTKNIKVHYSLYFSLLNVFHGTSPSASKICLLFKFVCDLLTVERWWKPIMFIIMRKIKSKRSSKQMNQFGCTLYGSSGILFWYCSQLQPFMISVATNYYWFYIYCSSTYISFRDFYSSCRIIKVKS